MTSKTLKSKIYGFLFLALIGWRHIFRTDTSAPAPFYILTVIPTWYATSCSSRILSIFFFVTHITKCSYFSINWFCYLFLNLNSYYSKLRHFLKSPLYYFVNCLFTTCKLVDIPNNNKSKKKNKWRRKKKLVVTRYLTVCL